MDTLFRIAHSANFNTGIQALLLIQHLSSARSLATDRFYRTLYESLLDPRLVTSSKHSLYLNLLLRALKNDVDVRRVKAFAKRMLQVATLHQPPFVCGLLYILAHLRGTFPDLHTLVDDPEESIFDDEPATERPVYDGRKRDPEHSNAQRSCLWELVSRLQRTRSHEHNTNSPSDPYPVSLSSFRFGLRRSACGQGPEGAKARPGEPFAHQVPRQVCIQESQGVGCRTWNVYYAASTGSQGRR